MTADDSHEAHRIHQQQVEEYKTCQRCIAQLGLDMQLVDVEHIFGGERVLVYYLAEGRVDFRELVRMLPANFRRGSKCGRSACATRRSSCRLRRLRQGRLLQHSSDADAARVDEDGQAPEGDARSREDLGRCGRLKCCLRYEFDVYEKMQKQLPPIGARVDTPEGRARVIGHEVLSGQVLVETDDRRTKLVDAAQTKPAVGDAPAPSSRRVEALPDRARRAVRGPIARARRPNLRRNPTRDD